MSNQPFPQQTSPSTGQQWFPIKFADADLDLRAQHFQLESIFSPPLLERTKSHRA
jgi:hypothetical protein